MKSHNCKIDQRKDYTAINWESLTDQQVSKALDQIARLTSDERKTYRETDFKVRYVYDDKLEKEGFCQECRKKLTGRQKSFCSDECGTTFFSRFWWQRIRSDVWVRDKRRCKECNIRLYRETTHTDHIIRIADGGLIFSMENYQTLCPECHQSKTSRENKGFTSDQTTITDFIQEES